MALAFNHLIDGTITSNGGSTSTINATSGARCLVAVGSSISSGNNEQTAALSGGGVTWTQITKLRFGYRRYLSLFVSSGTPSSASITITITTTGTFEQIKYSVDEITGFDSTTPLGTAATYTTGDTAAVTSASVSIGDTPDTGDKVYFCAGLQSNNDPSLNSELDTELVDFGDSTGCRRFFVAYDSSPDSTPAPGVTWTGTCSAAAIGVLVYAGAAEATKLPVFMYHYLHH